MFNGPKSEMVDWTGMIFLLIDCFVGTVLIRELGNSAKKTMEETIAADNKAQVSKTDGFELEMMNCVSNTRNCVSKTRDFVLILMNFAETRQRWTRRYVFE